MYQVRYPASSPCRFDPLTGNLTIKMKKRIFKKITNAGAANPSGRKRKLSAADFRAKTITPKPKPIPGEFSPENLYVPKSFKTRKLK
jgi:hypothetical protein